MSVSWSSARFRLRVFFVRMWRANECPRTILPPPVFLKRLAAPRWVFSFGMTVLLLRREDGGQDVALHARVKLDVGLRLDIAEQAREQLHSDLFVGDLASAELHDGLDFVAIAQEPQHIVLLELVIVLVGVGPKFHFFDDDVLLVLARLPGLLLHLILVFAEVHDSANRRLRSGGNLDEIEAFLTGDRQGFLRGQDAQLLAVFVDHANFTGADALVGAGPGLGDASRAEVGDKVLLAMRRMQFAHAAQYSMASRRSMRPRPGWR